MSGKFMSILLHSPILAVTRVLQNRTWQLLSAVSFQCVREILLQGHAFIRHECLIFTWMFRHSLENRLTRSFISQRLLLSISTTVHAFPKACSPAQEDTGRGQGSKSVVGWRASGAGKLGGGHLHVQLRPWGTAEKGQPSGAKTGRVKPWL